MRPSLPKLAKHGTPLRRTKMSSVRAFSFAYSNIKRREQSVTTIEGAHRQLPLLGSDDLAGLCWVEKFQVLEDYFDYENYTDGTGY